MYLRSVKPSIQIGMTEPCGAAVMRYFTEGQLRAEGGSISEGIAQGRTTGSMDVSKELFDFFMEVTDDEMLPVLHKLQAEEGIGIGGSAGINVVGAMKVAERLGPGHTVVTVLCDRADRYAGKLYNAEFLRSKDLPVPAWLETSIAEDGAISAALAQSLVSNDE